MLDEARELAILREVEELLREAKDALLMTERAHGCCGNRSQMVKVFRCQQAQKIAFRLDQLSALRK